MIFRVLILVFTIYSFNINAKSYSCDKVLGGLKKLQADQFFQIDSSKGVNLKKLQDDANKIIAEQNALEGIMKLRNEYANGKVKYLAIQKDKLDQIKPVLRANLETIDRVMVLQKIFTDLAGENVPQLESEQEFSDFLESKCNEKKSNHILCQNIAADDENTIMMVDNFYHLYYASGKNQTTFQKLGRMVDEYFPKHQSLENERNAGQQLERALNYKELCKNDSLKCPDHHQEIERLENAYLESVSDSIKDIKKFIGVDCTKRIQETHKDKVVNAFIIESKDPNVLGFNDIAKLCLTEFSKEDIANYDQKMKGLQTQLDELNKSMQEIYDSETYKGLNNLKYTLAAFFQENCQGWYTTQPSACDTEYSLRTAQSQENFNTLIGNTGDAIARIHQPSVQKVVGSGDLLNKLKNSCNQTFAKIDDVPRRGIHYLGDICEKKENHVAQAKYNRSTATYYDPKTGQRFRAKPKNAQPIFQGIFSGAAQTVPGYVDYFQTKNQHKQMEWALTEGPGMTYLGIPIQSKQALHNQEQAFDIWMDRYLDALDASQNNGTFDFTVTSPFTGNDPSQVFNNTYYPF